MYFNEDGSINEDLSRRDDDKDIIPIRITENEQLLY